MTVSKVMNELQRQHYLSALGADTYMPRWHLPCAPHAFACELPETQPDYAPIVTLESKIEINAAPIQVHKSTSIENALVSPVNNLIGDILETKKTTTSGSKPVSAADILAQLDSKPIGIDGFSLSIWR